MTKETYNKAAELVSMIINYERSISGLQSEGIFDVWGAVERFLEYEEKQLIAQKIRTRLIRNYTEKLEKLKAELEAL